MVGVADNEMSRFRNLVDSRSSGDGGVGALGRFRTVEYGGGVCGSCDDPGRSEADAEVEGTRRLPDDALCLGAGDPWRERV